MAKQWERPWTTEEMKENAANWNLAGDAGLLQHLQQFSQNLIERVHATNRAMDDMFRKLDNVETEINNVNNAFLSLANTQFVENRVYEDEDKDSPIADKDQVPQPKSKEASEAEMILRVKESLEIGFAVMDSKFNAIEVSGSDSEDEGSPSSVIRTVLEPKNPYLYQPLPHLIGSAEFMCDDSVGLVTANEDVMTPPLTTHSSTSDLNEDLVEESRASLVKQTSDWLSETEDVDMFGRDSSPDELDIDATSSQQAKSAASFAEELSSKLGGVATTNVEKKSSDLWDEPVKPSDSLSDSKITPKNVLQTGIPSLFGPSNDLFRDDDDDDDIFTVKNKRKPDVSSLFDESNSASERKVDSSPPKKSEPTLSVPNRALISTRKASTPNDDGAMSFSSPADVSKIVKTSGLFDDDDDDDDDLFNVSSNRPKQVAAPSQSSHASNNISVTSTEDSNIPAENELNIPFFGSPSSSGHFSFGDVSNVPFVPENLSKSVDKSAPANQSSERRTDDVAAKSKLFDDDINNDSLFQPTQRAPTDEVPYVVNKRPLSLFENDEQAPAVTPLPTERKTSEKNLFDDEDLFSKNSHEPIYDIFGGSQGKIKSDDDLFSFQPSSVGASDIFNTGNDETDDIFSVSQVGSTFNDDVEDLFSTSPSQKSQSSEARINPPGNFSKQTPDLFSVPQTSSTVNEDVEDLFSSSPSHKLQSSQAKITPPTNFSKPNSDLFAVPKIGSFNESIDNLFSSSPGQKTQPSEVKTIQRADVNKQQADLFATPKIGSSLKENVEDLFSSSPSQKTQSSEVKTTPPADVNKQKADLFAAPKIGSSLEENVEDLFSSSSSQKLQSSEVKINPPVSLSKQTMDLFLDDDDDGDLFGVNTSSSRNKNVSTLFHAASSGTNRESTPPLEHIPGNQGIFSNPLNSKVDNPNSKPDVANEDKKLGPFTEPLPAPRKVKTNEPLSSTVPKEGDTTQTKPWSKDKVIGKIKSPVGFVVDPLALLPGSKPPPRDKSTPHEPASGREIDRDNQARKISAGTAVKEKSQPDTIIATSTALPSSSSFDDAQVAPTLHSAVKERAKIQVKRRPQSRRARHEAIRSSALFADDDVTGTPPSEEPTQSGNVPPPEKPNIDAVPTLTRTAVTSSKATNLSDTLTKGALTAQDIASPSTDEEDLFGVPQMVYKDKGDVEDQLFGSATVLSPYGEKGLAISPKAESSTKSKSTLQPEVQKPKEENLPKTSSSVDILSADPFSSNENLFSSSTSSSKDGLFMGTSSKTGSKKTSLSKPKATTKSLFDDEDDDDIFSKPPKTSLPVATKSSDVPQKRITPPVVKSSLKKTEDPFNDPLTSLPQ